jgi:hypothetical protein
LGNYTKESPDGYDCCRCFTNEVSASGGGSAAAIANDVTAIAPSACDVNQDRNTNVSDAQVIINEGLGLAMAFNDLNHDGAVNIADAQIVINALLGGAVPGTEGPSPAVGPRRPGRVTFAQLAREAAVSPI